MGNEIADESITGKLTQPTADERTATLELARAIIDAEQNDEEWPKLDVDIDLVIFRLAQDLVTATAERDRAERSIAAWIRKHAEHLDPRVESSARKFLLELAADIELSRWPRQPKESP